MGRSGAVAVAPDGRAALALSVPRAPSGKAYEAWVIQARRAQRAGLFDGGSETSIVGLDGRVPAGAVVAVTVERAGGVDQPTQKPFVDERGTVVTLLQTAPPPARPSRDLAHLSDEALLSLVASSDDAALGELYDRFGGVAYGLALRILRDESLAQDAVQEAFLGVWRTADRFLAERAAARTWILTLVHRRAVDLVRREDRRRGEPLEGAPEPAARETVDEEAAVRFQRRVVQEALRQLTPEQREALELGYYGGLTQSELAEQLDQPLGTVKSRMFAGLAQLRELLAQAGLEGSLSG